MGGNSVSHSNIKTKRKFYPNLQTKKFYIPEEDKYHHFKGINAGIRTINKKGISVCLKEAREKGFLKNKRIMHDTKCCHTSWQHFFYHLERK